MFRHRNEYLLKLSDNMSHVEYNIGMSVRPQNLGENLLWTCVKQCSFCKDFKSLNDFPKRVAISNGRNARCKSCEATYKSSLYFKSHEMEKNKRRDYYKKNKETVMVKNRDYYRKTCKESNVKRRCKKRGISIEQYNEMLIEQNFSCDICSKWLNEKERSIDHCHQTNTVRGILCDNCNTGLGLFKDSIEFLNQASRYLIKHKK